MQKNGILKELNIFLLNVILSNAILIKFSALPLQEDSKVIAFYSPSCFGQETAKEPFGFSGQASSTCPPVYHTRWRLHTDPLNAERQVRKL